MSDSKAPRPPTIIRIQPTVTMSKPFTLASTANARIAPTAIRKRLAPSPIYSLLFAPQPPYGLFVAYPQDTLAMRCLCTPRGSCGASGQRVTVHHVYRYRHRSSHSRHRSHHHVVAWPSRLTANPEATRAFDPALWGQFSGSS